MEENKIIEGVGKDAEIITNKNGGQQSKTPMALHLLDPLFLQDMVILQLPKIENDSIKEAISYISFFMTSGCLFELRMALTKIEPNAFRQIIRIGETLLEGADRYAPNNWRLIPQEEHINHALIHLLAAAMGDTQDNHLDHAMCRIMMAYATKKSKGFDYNKFIKKDVA